MVRTVSLLPLAAALLSAFLAVFTATTAGFRDRTARYFIVMNLGTALWCGAYTVQMNLGPNVEAILADPGSAVHALLVVQALGVAIAPTFAFLFAASYAHREDWLAHKWVAFVLLVFTFVVASTNPWHHLFITGTDGVSYTYGPLAPLHQVPGSLLGMIAFWLIVSTSWRRGTPSGRRQALVIGLAGLVPLVGGIVWGLRYELGIVLTVNLSPVLAPIGNLALGYELIARGLADIAPYAALNAFNALSDGGIVLDDAAFVVAINPAARRLFPKLTLGERLDGEEELAHAAEVCLGSNHGYMGFDMQLGGLLYWVRVRRATDRRGDACGCVILLTDVTELRATQARIVELSRRLDEDIVRPRSEPRVERRESQA